MVAYTSERVKHLLKIDFIRFCIVGGTGFVINFAILALLHRFTHLPIFYAQLVGSEIALFSNFMLHHHWTYKAYKVDKSFPKLLLQFHATTWPAILGSTFMVTFFVGVFRFDDLFALAASSFIALFWNFGWSKYVIWRNITSNDIDNITE
jgi:putative flippase GtrA